MSQRFYPAIITKGRDPGYTIQFFDLPEAISEGDTIEQAILHGQEALALALECRVEEGDTIPAPTDLATVTTKVHEGKHKGGTFIQLVPGHEPEPVVRLNVTLPGDLVKRIDAVAGERGRSGWLAHAAKSALSQSVIPVKKAVPHRKAASK